MCNKFSILFNLPWTHPPCPISALSLQSQVFNNNKCKFLGCFRPAFTHSFAISTQFYSNHFSYNHTHISWFTSSFFWRNTPKSMWGWVTVAMWECRYTPEERGHLTEKSSRELPRCFSWMNKTTLQLCYALKTFWLNIEPGRDMGTGYAQIVMTECWN